MSSLADAGCSVVRAWHPDDGVLAALHECFLYVPGEDRATGVLYAPADGKDWPAPLAGTGPRLLDDLAETTGVRFTICAFQAYRDGAGCGWHADTPFGAQAILSLGVTRTFGIRRAGGSGEQLTPVSDGDLVFMPEGFQAEWQHSVLPDDSSGERCSLVFRTPGRAA